MSAGGGGAVDGRTRARGRGRLELLREQVGPGGMRMLLVLGGLAVIRALGLVLLAGAVADGIAAVAVGSVPGIAAVLPGAVGVLLRAGGEWALAVAGARHAVAAKTELRAGLVRRMLRGGVGAASAGDRGVVREGGTAAEGAGGASTASPLGDGGIAVLATHGLDDLDAYYGSVIPAAVNAAAVPVVLGLRILGADLLSTVIVVLTLPLVPIFMALIGMHTRDRVDAATGALARMADHLVELARGLPVLVGLGRIDEQTAALGRLQDDYRRRTTGTLRTAFLSALALELIATISVAVVAVVLGLRLLGVAWAGGPIGLSSALLVLILAPECFGAVREVGTAFHAAQDGRSALRRATVILRSPLPVRRRLAGGELRIDGLEVRYAGRTQAALARTFAEFETGRITAITGPSGAGKSTLLAAIADVLPADADVDGVVRGLPAGRIAYAAQHPHALAATVREELALAADGQADAVDAVLGELALEGVAASAPAELSPGELRRVGVARALLRVDAGAVLLLLDEPTAHLDDDSAERVRGAIRDRAERATVVLVTHEPRTLALAEHRLVLRAAANPTHATQDGGTAPALVGSAAAVGPELRGGSGAEAAAAASDAGGTHPHPADPARRRRPRVRVPWGMRAALAVLLAAAATGLGLALTGVSGWLIVRASEGPAILYLLVAIVGVRFFGIGRSVARYGERLATHDAVFDLTDRMRLRLWRAIAARGAGSRALLEGGSALDYLVTLTSRLRDLLPRIVPPLAVGVLAVVGITVTAALIAPSLALLTGLLLAAALVIPAAVAIAAARRSERIGVTVRSELTRRITALGGAADELRANGLAEAAAARIDAADAERAAAEHRGAAVAGLASALATVFTGALAILVAPAAAASASGISGETAAVLGLLALAVLEPITAALAAAQRIPTLAAVRARLRPLLEEPVALRNPASAATTIGADAGFRSATSVPVPELTHPVRTLELEGVGVAWAPGLRDLDARVDAREWLVVEGPSGSGKTTLLTVLMGALAPTVGRVRADGIDIAELDPTAWRSRVVWTPQEAHVFDSTLRGNLLLARPREDAVSDDEMRAVLARVGLGPLLGALEEGLDAAVGAGGHALSGGERQRLAVARALLGRGDILLLDEPTAHLDAPTAAAMMHDIRRAAGDRIVVLVSHRADDAEPGDLRIDLGSHLIPTSGGSGHGHRTPTIGGDTADGSGRERA